MNSCEQQVRRPVEDPALSGDVQFIVHSNNLMKRRRIMFTKRNALMLGILFILLFTSACGAAAPAATQVPATEAPSYNNPPEEPAATEAPATQAPALPEPLATSYAPNPPISNPNAPIPQSNREPYDMFFQNYGVNPSIDTEDDHLSTFAMDV